MGGVAGQFPQGAQGSNRFVIYVQEHDSDEHRPRLHDGSRRPTASPPALPRGTLGDAEPRYPLHGKKSEDGERPLARRRAPRPQATRRTAPRWRSPPTTWKDTVAQIVRIEVITSIIALVVLGFLSWLLTGIGLRPLRRMQRSAADHHGRGRPQPPGRATRRRRPSSASSASTLNEDARPASRTSFAAQQETETKLRRFVADASHELRTPLTSIRGSPSTTGAAGARPDQVQRSMTRIEQESERMGHMVDDLLTLARHDEGAPMEVGRVELAPMITSLADDLRAVQPERPISVDDRPADVDGDAERIFQAISNLAVNARVHTPPSAPIELVWTRSPSTAPLWRASPSSTTAPG